MPILASRLDISPDPCILGSEQESH
jgi:hypothetical protein